MSLSALSSLVSPHLPQATVLLLSSRSLGFQPSPLLTPFLLSLILHLVSTSPSFLSTVALLPLLSLGTALGYFSEIYSALGSKTEAAMALILVGGVLSSFALGLVAGWSWVERKEFVKGRKIFLMVGFIVLWSGGWALWSGWSPLGRQVRSNERGGRTEMERRSTSSSLLLLRFFFSLPGLLDSHPRLPLRFSLPSYQDLRSSSDRFRRSSSSSPPRQGFVPSPPRSHRLLLKLKRASTTTTRPRSFRI